MIAADPPCSATGNTPVKLVQPSAEWADSFFEAMEEYRQAGEPQLSSRVTRNTFEAYLNAVEQGAKGEGLPTGYVPATEYWIVDRDGYAGRITLRHFLTPELERFGGHIGYSIRPGKRRLGYASHALRLVLKEAHRRMIQEVILTCDESNTGSRKVIENNGGVQRDIRAVEGADSVVRYSITLP